MVRYLRICEVTSWWRNTSLITPRVGTSTSRAMTAACKLKMVTFELSLEWIKYRLGGWPLLKTLTLKTHCDLSLKKMREENRRFGLINGTEPLQEGQGLQKKR